MKANDWKAISLFAGAGGCSLGFKYAGINMITAFDNANAAIETYNANFGDGKAKNVDLSSCDFLEIRNNLGLKRGELDLIIGGPRVKALQLRATDFGTTQGINSFKTMRKLWKFFILAGL